MLDASLGGFDPLRRHVDEASTDRNGRGWNEDGEALLRAANPAREIIIVDRPGWHVAPGLTGQLFVCPDGAVVGAPEAPDLELAADARMAPM